MTEPIAMVRVAAAAAAVKLPLPETPTAGSPVPGAEAAADIFALLPSGAGALVRATWTGAPGTTAAGEVAVVVGSALTEALANSPLGALDIAAAVQPAVDAITAALGGTAATGAVESLDEVLPTLLERADTFFVPLTDAEGWVCATLVVVLPGTGPGFAPDPVATAMTAPPAAAPPAAAIPRQAAPNRVAFSAGTGLELLRDVVLEVTVELGRTRMAIANLLSLAPGAVVELDRAAGSPADLLVNGTLIARGEVVVVDEDFGIRITEIVGTTTPVAEFLAGRQVSS